MKEHAFRLTKGQDLKVELEKYVQDNNIKAGIIVSCVGCLVNTTAEIVIVELENYCFSREMDKSAGYRELVINKNMKS